MRAKAWDRRWAQWRGHGPVEADLTPYREALAQVHAVGEGLRKTPMPALQQQFAHLRAKAQAGQPLEVLLPQAFALTREVADRVLGLRPYDVQVMAGVALHRGKLVEMNTGEGKTLAAVLPAALHALTAQGVHILTFNDYLAQRDATWMDPIYAALGLSVGAIQAGQSTAERRAAYAADVTYATAKEAGFDSLRAGLARATDALVQRPFHYAIVDEADSILIDEARVPLVIAGARETSDADPYRLATLVADLAEGTHWALDEHGRNVYLTEPGLDCVEAALGCGPLHEADNTLLLTEVNQALHARTLLHRDVDYIVRGSAIALVDEFTGRVVEDRRWPDGLQAALEAKEGLPIQPGGRILGSITLHHFLAQYPTLAGMTATAQPAAEELKALYDLAVVPIPPHRPCIRDDRPDRLFTHQAAKTKALLQAITEAHVRGRPVLVGTSSVEASERLAAALATVHIPCRVLNAKHDAAEAEIVAQAGALGAVTIATNMAGRGTDIRLGGADEADRDRVVSLGGLLVIGTHRHESRRIDDQLRGRAGRQGDPGTSQFYTSLDDPLLVRFGIDSLIPQKLRPARQDAALHHPVLHHEVERLQRIVEGQNHEIRTTLARYTALVEKQRQTLFAWRNALLAGTAEPTALADHDPSRYAALCARFNPEQVAAAERAVTLHHLDACWADHLAFIAEVREGIHLVGLGGQDPLHEFHKQVAQAFGTLHATIEARTAETMAALDLNDAEALAPLLRGPSATWTYLVNDRALTELQQLLFAPGASAFSAGAVVMTWPLLLGWALWRKLGKRTP